MLENILSAFYSDFWCILPEKYDQIEAYLLARMQDGKFPPMILDAPKAMGGRPPAYTNHGSVAVVPIHGVIYPRGGANPESGLTTGEHISSAVTKAADDSGVSAIVLDINSPGGTVAGTTEAMAAIRAARDRKPVHASIFPIGASGGYGLASQATSISVNPTTQVGSVGVMRQHVDKSAMLEKLGIRITDVKSVAGKNDYPSHLPLSDDVKAHFQDEVDRLHRTFVSTIASGRGRSAEHVEQHFGRGRMLWPDDAMRVGMVDRIATLDQVVSMARENAAAKDRMRAKAKILALSA